MVIKTFITSVFFIIIQKGFVKMRNKKAYPQKGFTKIENTLIRDSRLSLKAKGLYCLIKSYITCPDIELTKSFIFYHCSEGKKACESAWNELKSKGYLKMYVSPSSDGWKTRIELLDIPREGAHTFYLSAKGTVSCTNLTRNVNRQPHLPQKGVYAERYNADSTNNITTYNNTKSNLSVTAPSFILKTKGKNEPVSTNKIIEEIDILHKIPYDYAKNPEKMAHAIHYLTDWDITSNKWDSDQYFQQTYNLAVKSLIEMTCAPTMCTYNQNHISPKQVIDKINAAIKIRSINPLSPILEEAVKDYIAQSKKVKIQYPKKYLKSCIWESFDTYTLKFHSFFERTYSADF